MNRKIVKTVTITSWLFAVLNIVLPFTGVITRDWGNTSIWTTLSIIWTTIWVDDLDKIKQDKIKEQHDKTKAGL
jgi:hypothetical protein